MVDENSNPTSSRNSQIGDTRSTGGAHSDAPTKVEKYLHIGQSDDPIDKAEANFAKLPDHLKAAIERAKRLSKHRPSVFDEEGVDEIEYTKVLLSGHWKRVAKNNSIAEAMPFMPPYRAPEDDDPGNRTERRMDEIMYQVGKTIPDVFMENRNACIWGSWFGGTDKPAKGPYKCGTTTTLKTRQGDTWEADGHYGSLSAAMRHVIRAQAHHYKGVGFNLRPANTKLGVIDVDGGLSTAEIPDQPLARRLLDNPAGRFAALALACGHYCTISPSGTGLHFWFIITEDFEMPMLYPMAYVAGVEVFIAGLEGPSQRFVSFTGHRYHHKAWGPDENMEVDPSVSKLFDVYQYWAEVEKLDRDLDKQSTGGQPAQISSRAALDIDKDFFPIEECRGDLDKVIRFTIDPFKVLNRVAIAHPDLWFDEWADNMGLRVTMRSNLNWRAVDPGGYYEEAYSLSRGKRPGLKDFRLWDDPSEMVPVPGRPKGRQGSRSVIDAVLDMIYVMKTGDASGRHTAVCFPRENFHKMEGIVKRAGLEEDDQADKDGVIPNSEEVQDAREYWQMYLDMRNEAIAWLHDKLSPVLSVTPEGTPAPSDRLGSLILSRYCRETMVCEHVNVKGGKLQSRWHEFDGLVYKTGPQAHMRVQNTLGQIGNKFVNLFPTKEGKPRVSLQEGSFAKRAMETAALEPGLVIPDHREMDDKQSWGKVGIRNNDKVWNAITGEFEKPNPDDLMTAEIPGYVALIGKGTVVDPIRPDPNTDIQPIIDFMAHQFGEENAEAMAEHLVCWFAQHGLGGNQWKEIHLMNGVGNSGKSTILELKERVLGRDLAGPMDSKVLDSRGGRMHPTAMMPVHRYRSVDVDEMSGNVTLDAGTLKQLTNTEKTGRGMYEDDDRNFIRGSIMISTNVLPKLAEDHGNAVFNRLRVFNFEKPVNWTYEDRERFLACADALRSRVLLKMVEIVKQNSLPQHPIMEQARLQIRQNWCPLETMLADAQYVALDPRGFEMVRDIAAAVAVSAKDNNQNKMSAKAVSTKLKEVGEALGIHYVPKEKNPNGYPGFSGLRLNLSVRDHNVTWHHGPGSAAEGFDTDNEANSEDTPNVDQKSAPLH